MCPGLRGLQNSRQHGWSTALAGAGDGFRVSSFAGDYGISRLRQGPLNRFGRTSRNGRFYQVNFTSRLSASFRGESLPFHRALQAEQPNGYHAFIDTGEGALLSLVAGIVFTLHGSHVTTQPMKAPHRAALRRRDDDRIAWALAHSDKGARGKSDDRGLAAQRSFAHRRTAGLGRSRCIVLRCNRCRRCGKMTSTIHASCGQLGVAGCFPRVVSLRFGDQRAQSGNHARDSRLEARNRAGPIARRSDFRPR